MPAIFKSIAMTHYNRLHFRAVAAARRLASKAIGQKV